MNKQIAVLASKSGFDVGIHDGLILGNFSDMYKLQKFAELIVRECSKVNNQYVGWRIGDIDLDMVYKEHFGVE